MLLSLIVAMAENRVIGHHNQLPWHLPADLQFFKRTTLGKPVIMGRKTFQSIGRPLPQRPNIVISARPDYRAEGCAVVHSLDQALTVAGEAAEVMVIGGAQVFAEALPRAERIYLTRIGAVVAGDVLFPELNPAQWRELWREDHDPDPRNPLPYSFTLLARVEATPLPAP